MKLNTNGSGKWESSAGLRSKFGLTISEILEALAVLHQRDMADCFALLHFHLGSQVTNIRHVKEALIEAARVYTDLVKRGAGLKYLDVGGGLAVDYNGSQTSYEYSMNYTLDEYVNDVVYYIQSVCDTAGVRHPDIISESGRAIAAYHSVLVFEVLGVAGPGAEPEIDDDIEDDHEQPLQDLLMTYREMSTRNLLESFHDAQLALEMTMRLFSTGHLPLHKRALAENLFWAICDKIRRLVDELDYVPEDLKRLDPVLATTYFCNFSLFQSMPDSWAIKQLFPVVPIHRLDERPICHAVLGDITCDSDGKIAHFIDCQDIRRTLPLHPFDDAPYYLAAFLVGAYQETLGDLHNLFGDTNAVHVDLTDDGIVALDALIKGDTVKQVLEYVHYKGADLIDRLQAAVETAVRERQIDEQEAGECLRLYENALNGYTYLDKPHPA